MIKILRIFVIILLVISYSSAFSQKPPVEKQAESPKVTVLDENGKPMPLRMNELKIDVKVIGNLARTTMEMTFVNDSNRIFEGELSFPLGEGQSITRFAMDFSGKLREGVVVEKAKGREVYEEVVRKNIDPALLEQTEGNSFKARIYPIPAKGTKKIVIAYEHELISNSDGMSYLLPLNFKYNLDKFDMTVEVYGDRKPDASKSTIAGIDFRKNENFFGANVQYRNYTADKQFEFLLPNSGAEKTIYYENDGNQTYFYINMQVPVEKIDKRLPKKICLLWDNSSSSSGRDLDKEIAVLNSYFKKINNCSIELVTFSNEADKSESYVVSGGNWDALEKRLRALPSDGGTQLGSLDLNKYSCDEFILSSDGISNFGEKEIILANTPVIVINSNQTAEHAYLQYVAQKTGGQYLNLLNLTEEQASGLIQTQTYVFLSAVYNSGEIAETYPSMPSVISNNFTFSGKMLSERAELTLNFGSGANIIHTEKIELIKNGKLIESGLLNRIWAMKKLAELDLRYETNKDAITELGKEFSIVTRNTSLIILDRVEDYIKYKIVPPEDMKQEYLAKTAQIDSTKKIETSTHLDYVLKLFKERKDWWNKDFTPEFLKKDTIKSKKDSETQIRVDGVDNALEPTPRANQDNALEPSNGGRHEKKSKKAPSRRDGNEGSGGSSRSTGFASESRSAEALMVGGAPASPTGENNQTVSSIEIKKWDPAAPYLEKLKATTADKYYETYLGLKKEYGSSTGFYLDVSDFFADNHLEKQALKILSNIAELELENRQLLRILAHRLEQLGYNKLAILIFKEVLKISEEEPQSYRDLGLALAIDGQFQQSSDMLYEVVDRKWDSRFGEIELIALGEMNNVISKSGGKVDVSKYDSRLIENLPMDMRIVLNWDADNCDMDLWVFDPNNEKCFYSHRDTRIGCHLSRDFTGGYGPEEFIIKKAMPGKYKVQVNYFGSRQQRIVGPTTIMMEMYTNYGTPKEIKKSVTMRVKDLKEVVDIGEFEFKEK